MPDPSFPITDTADAKGLVTQFIQLLDELYTERVGGANLGDVFGIGDDDILALTLATDPGLYKTGNALKVKVKSGGGITLDEDGLANTGAFFASGTKMLFYQNTAPTGWTIENTLNDKLVFITKGSVAGGLAGGIAHAMGTWTQPNHTHLMSSHLHSISNDGAHTHEVDVVGGTLTSSFPAGNTDPTTDQEADHNHTGSTGTNNQATAGGATANTWRPSAYNCIIAEKD